MSGTFAAGADMKSEEEEVLALHNNDFLDLSVAGKLFTGLLEIMARARCPDDEKRNASQFCDERRDIIVVDIAAALMVLLYIIIMVIYVIAVYLPSIFVRVRVSMLIDAWRLVEVSIPK